MKRTILTFLAGVLAGLYLVFGCGDSIGSRFNYVGTRLEAAATPTYVDAALTDFAPPSKELKAAFVEPVPRQSAAGRRRR